MRYNICAIYFFKTFLFPKMPNGYSIGLRNFGTIFNSVQRIFILLLFLDQASDFCCSSIKLKF